MAGCPTPTTTTTREVHPVNNEDPTHLPVSKLPTDEQDVLCHWAVTDVAESMRITRDDALDLLANAHDAGRLTIMGNRHFVGVQVDDEWIVVVDRDRLTQATHEWVTLRELEREFSD
jgi:hypothetical protein